MTRRVLFVNHTGSVSGAEISLRDLLSDPQIAAMLASPAGPIRGLVARIPTLEIPELFGGLRAHPRHTADQLVRIARAAAIVRHAALRAHAEVVHANSIRGGLIAALARRTGAPPFVAHIRDCLPHNRIALLTRRVIIGSADAVIANSQYTLDNFLSAGGVTARSYVVYNAVDTTRFHPDAARRRRTRDVLGVGVGDGDFALGVVGQLTPHKRQDTAIEVTGSLRQLGLPVRLFIVGEAKFTSDAARHDNLRYERRLRDMASSLPAGAVTFLGERRDMPDLYRAFDVLLVPTDEEPFGRTVIEAMASGVVAVATSVGGPREIVDNDRTGLLARPGHTAEWASAIAGLLTAPHRRRAMREAAVVDVTRRFSVDAHRAAVHRVYAAVSYASGSGM